MRCWSDVSPPSVAFGIRVFCNVDQSASDAAITNAILSLGASLNLTVTAEGVEREGQLAWLRPRGCDEVQGFLLPPPARAPAVSFGLGGAIPRDGAAPGSWVPICIGRREYLTRTLEIISFRGD